MGIWGFCAFCAASQACRSSAVVYYMVQEQLFEVFE